MELPGKRKCLKGGLWLRREKTMAVVDVTEEDADDGTKWR